MLPVLVNLVKSVRDAPFNENFDKSLNTAIAVQDKLALQSDPLSISLLCSRSLLEHIHTVLWAWGSVMFDFMETGFISSKYVTAFYDTMLFEHDRKCRLDELSNNWTIHVWFYLTRLFIENGCGK